MNDIITKGVKALLEFLSNSLLDEGWAPGEVDKLIEPSNYDLWTDQVEALIESVRKDIDHGPITKAVLKKAAVAYVREGATVYSADGGVLHLVTPSIEPSKFNEDLVKQVLQAVEEDIRTP